ncbi:MAG TPA: VWA domain-containing protein [Gemmatimonadales bacterium]
MSFDAPMVLLVAPIVGGAAWFAAAWARHARLKRAARWSPETERAARAAGRFGPTTVSVAVFLGVVALSGPRWGEDKVSAETRGLDLVIAMDISRSMLAEDVGPSRLGRAQREGHRLVEDLDGDRIGLLAFAGASYILAPLTVDGSALTLYLDAMDPDIASAGGTDLAAALVQGTELLQAGSELSDRVLVVFTDGEAHDTLPGILDAAQRLGTQGIHLILVAEGGRVPARIPVRDDQGALLGWQRDADDNIIATARDDAVLSRIADAAQGTLVAADLPDQAGAVRDLVASYKRTRASESRTHQGRPRAWLPLLVAVCLLVGQAATRRTAALLTLALLAGAPLSARAQGQLRRTASDRAWDAGDAARALRAYEAALSAGVRTDTTYYNAGTAALAAGDVETARARLAQAVASLDPDLRFRALFNLGVVELRAARTDSANHDAHAADAARAYREALLLAPHDSAAKWNFELATREAHHGGASSPSRKPSGGGGGQPPPAGGGDQSRRNSGGGGAAGALSAAQADDILRSIGQEELRTRRDHVGRKRHAAEPRVKDW